MYTSYYNLFITILYIPLLFLNIVNWSCFSCNINFIVLKNYIMQMGYLQRILLIKKKYFFSYYIYIVLQQEILTFLCVKFTDSKNNGLRCLS